MELDPDSLPQSVQCLVEEIGLAKTLRLVDAYGGIRLWVPQRLPEDHALRELIGEEAAAQLVKVFGGDVLSVPTCHRAVRSYRDQEIRERRAQGEPVWKLARTYGLTERQVFSVLAAGAPSRIDQGSLL